MLKQLVEVYECKKEIVDIIIVVNISILFCVVKISVIIVKFVLRRNFVLELLKILANSKRLVVFGSYREYVKNIRCNLFILFIISILIVNFILKVYINIIEISIFGVQSCSSNVEKLFGFGDMKLKMYVFFFKLSIDFQLKNIIIGFNQVVLYYRGRKVLWLSINIFSNRSKLFFILLFVSFF